MKTIVVSIIPVMVASVNFRKLLIVVFIAWNQRYIKKYSEIVTGRYTA